MSQDLCVNLSEYYRKFKNLLVPYNDCDCSEDKLGKCFGFSALYLCGIIFKSILRNKASFSEDNKGPVFFAMLLLSFPTIASIAYCPKNIVPILLGVATAQVTNIDK